MEFTSLSFLLFVPIFFALYWMSAKRLRIQNMLVVAASYTFYGWWSWEFLWLLLATTVTSYSAGLLIDRQRSHRRLWLTLCIVINLGILAYFKYFNFFVESLRSLLLSVTDLQADWFSIEVLLPVGISFYTFQALSYAIDVYRGKITATRDILAFASYISFFPQLVAGPIERSMSLLPQFLRHRHFDYAEAVTGLRQMLWGFFKKLVVADNCAFITTYIFGNIEAATWAELLLAAVCFTLQIYGDFSGYSDIAIGTARLFGIRLSRNFNLPLFATNIADFWRRWHITLTRWFTDYLYIPLGGSRHGAWRTVINILIVFTLSGLWHGAAWPFVVWGVYNGLLVAGYNVISRRNPLNTVRTAADDSGMRLTLSRTGRMAATFALVVIGFVIFRCETMADAVTYLSRLLTADGSGTKWSILLGRVIQISLAIGFGALMLVIEWTTRRREFALDLHGRFNTPVRWAIYLVTILAILMFNGVKSEFIYFRF